MASRRGSAPMHEREEEVTALRGAVDAARAGQGTVMLVEGPPGIGKTRLLQTAEETARAAGLTVLTARGAEFEQGEPYGVVRQLLERELLTAPTDRRARLLAGVAAHAAPLLAAHPVAEPDAFAVLHGTYWLVANLTGERPVLLVVDDLQWADGASARFLAYLARRSADLPLLLAGALRPREADDPVLHELFAAPHATLLQPRALSRPAAAALLQDAFGTAPAAPFTDACHEATGGNPFLLGQLAVALRADDVRPTGGAARQVAELGSTAIQHALVLRLGRLPPQARALAAAVAVLGDEVRLRDAAAVAGLADPEAATAHTALVRADILVDRLPVAFVHPLVRAALHADLDAGHRAALHARSADVLHAAGERPERAAHHLLAVEPAADHDRAQLLLLAGRSALARGAPDAALPFLERALAEPPRPADHATTLTLLGTAGMQVDPSGPARGHLRTAIAATPDRRERGALWLALARATMMSDSMAAGVAVAQEGLADLEGLDDIVVDRLRTELLCQAATHPATAHLADGIRPGDAAPAGDTAAERLQLCVTLLGEGRGAGTAARTRELGRRALGGTALVEDESSESLVVPQLIHHLLYADAHDEATRLCAALEADARRRGTTWGTIAAAACTAWVQLRHGDVAVAEVEARRALAPELLPLMAQPFTIGGLVAALTWSGQLEEAERYAEASGCGPRTDVLIHSSMLFTARGWLRSAQGRHAEALDDFLEHGRRAARLAWDPPGTAWRAEAAEQLLLLGRREEGAALAQEQLMLARRWGAPSGIAAGLRAAGLAAEPGEEALTLLAEAAAALDGQPLHLERARALIALGGAQRRAGLPAARETLTQAFELADACGAGWPAGQADAELRALGSRPRVRTRSGAAALTAGERRVCELAAAGLSNREIAGELFVTAKTVENHLGRAYAKLGVSSRAQLPSALA